MAEGLLRRGSRLSRRVPATLLLLLVFEVGCRAKLPPPPERTPWRTFPMPAVDGPLFDGDPWLRDEANGWRTAYDPIAGEPGRALRGAIGLGNGHVFGFIGIGEPDLATIHEAIGPGLDSGDGYFSDVQFHVRVGGQKWQPTGEWQWRVRHTAIGVTLLRGEGLDVLLVDFAPWLRSSWWAPPLPEERALVRLVSVRATGDLPAGNVTVSMVGRGTWTVGADGLRHTQKASDQRALLVAEGGAADASRREVALDFGALAAGAEARGSFTLGMALSEEEEAATRAALAPADPLDLLRRTRTSWREWATGGAQLATPEPMLDDLVDATRVLLKVQQAANGAVMPMSEYTHVWLRDTIGPVMGFLSLGHPEDAQRALDYLWVALVERGDLANALSGALPMPAELPEGPSFAGLPPLSGRVRAEGPSYVVLEHDELVRWTGRRETVDRRFRLLRRCLFGQQLSPDDLLPFSGDETFRAAMAAVMGDSIVDQQYTEGYQSLDSSVLLVTAAERLAGHARSLGRDEDAAELDALARRVRSAAEATYWSESSGWYLPFVSPDGTLAPLPFEDASLKPAWLGFLEAEPARARRSIKTLWDFADHTAGFPISRPQSGGLTGELYPPAATGMFTGMSPGYFLGAAARADLAEGALGLDALGRTASTTGSWEEDQAREDFSSVALFYDEAGRLGEYTARYRPWEGGINIRAIFDWLVGFTPTLQADGSLSLAVVPHLPAGWPSLKLTGARIGDAQVELQVSETWTDEQRSQRLTVSRAGGTASLSVRPGLRLEGTELLAVRVEGKAVDVSKLGLERDAVGPRLRFDLPPRELAAGGRLTVEVDYR